ncbi:hypothetical protein LY78DRAFT_150611 [Colletotrichum sublineola]|nr:hypothetical protein LY78DRAFT_150611 [Colletotrichum sublineola]
MSRLPHLPGGRPSFKGATADSLPRLVFSVQDPAGSSSICVKHAHRRPSRSRQPLTVLFLLSQFLGRGIPSSLSFARLLQTYACPTHLEHMPMFGHLSPTHARLLPASVVSAHQITELGIYYARRSGMSAFAQPRNLFGGKREGGLFEAGLRSTSGWLISLTMLDG